VSLLHTARRHRQTPAELRAENKQLHEDIAKHHKLFAELGDAYLRLRELFDETGIELSGARLDNEKLRSLLEKRNGQVIRQAADLARLRQAVIDARPKITFATAPRIPPFAPLESIPMDTGKPLTVGRWQPFPPDADSDDTTVNIPLADLLAAGVTPRLSDRLDTEQTVTVGRDRSTA
jgi:hypothetical protein